MLAAAIAESLAESGGEAAAEGSSFGVAPLSQPGPGKVQSNSGKKLYSSTVTLPLPPSSTSSPSPTPNPGHAWLNMDKKWSASGERRTPPRKPTKDRRAPAPTQTLNFTL